MALAFCRALRTVAHSNRAFSTCVPLASVSHHHASMKGSLTADTLNRDLLRAKYAVRGEIVLKALEMVRNRCAVAGGQIVLMAFTVH